MRNNQKHNRRRCEHSSAWSVVHTVMTRRRARILAITAVTFVVLVVSAGATFLYLVERALHANDGPPHVFVLEGDRRLTDEQAIDFARQAMTLDGRMSAGT